MPELILSEIYIYPIKSLGGIRLKTAKIEKRGLQYDRRWMLIDEGGRFISQREYPRLALLQVEITEKGLFVTHKQGSPDSLLVPFQANDEKTRLVTIWEDVCFAFEVNQKCNNWFSDYLGFSCQLVFMPDNALRPVDQEYGRKYDVVSFADAFPFLLIGQESLNDLNGRLAEPVRMDRFRPNLVFKGGWPFAEDNWLEFKIGETTFFPVKPCSRCNITTINQQTAIATNEPLKTLASYRTVNNKVMFGQNLIHTGVNTQISEGQPLILID